MIADYHLISISGISEERNVMKKALKELLIETINMAWTGVVIGGGIAMGFLAVLALLIH